MKSAHKIEHLHQVPLFSGLSKRELNEIAKHLDEATAPAGTRMAEEGKLSRQFGIIVSGGADVRRNTRRLAKLEPGDFFGEMALLLKRPSSATVTLTEDSTVLVMHARQFDIVLDSFPSIWKKMAVGLADRLLEADRKLSV